MKIIIICTIVFCGILFRSIVFAAEIKSFDVSIDIRPDASLSVKEDIAYDFGTQDRHGIFRDIPVEYSARGGTYGLRISDIRVVDAEGNAYPFAASRQGENLHIKIGDPNTLVSGLKTYSIRYSVRRAINYFETYDELYWNVTGNDWAVPIQETSATVRLPRSVEVTALKADCFIGYFSSRQKCLRADAMAAGGAAERVEFDGGKLSSGEGLTVVVGFPKNLVSRPSVFLSLLETVRDNWILVLPLLTLGGLFYLWWTRGRDPSGRGETYPQYDAPDDLRPAEVGTLIDEKAQNRDVSASIVDLAVRGYLKITRTEEKGLLTADVDYIFEQLKNGDGLKNVFEKNLLTGFFAKGRLETAKLFAAEGDTKADGPILGTVRLSVLKETFYKTLQGIKRDIYETLVSKGYFAQNPNTVRGIYIGIGVALIFCGIFIGRAWGGLEVFSFILSGIFCVAFSFAMPRRTQKGVTAKEHIIGLKTYLAAAEKDRLGFHMAPEKNPERFEKLLPYAMVLGVEEKWAKQFEGIYTQPPRWYSDQAGGHVFNVVLFTHSLNSFSSHVNSVLASTPRSAAGGGSGLGGGGFSGGGFGGGGGGSW